MASTRLTTEMLKSLNAIAVGGKPAVVKPNELASALARPANTAFYSDFEVTPTRLAADLAWGIIKNHPFADGNKRTAFLAANEYLREKGVVPFVDMTPESFTAETVETFIQVIGEAHNKVATDELSSAQLGEEYKKILENSRK